MTAVSLPVEPLTRAAFAPYGQVIETAGAVTRMINEGTTTRFHDLAEADVAADDGVAIVSIFRAVTRPRPLAIVMMERHPLGSQAFYPLSNHDWLVVVGTGGEALDLASLRCFRASGMQGVNYARNVWHHPLLVLVPEQDFLVVDRKGPGANLEETWFRDQQHSRVIAL